MGFVQAFVVLADPADGVDDLAGPFRLDYRAFN